MNRPKHFLRSTILIAVLLLSGGALAFFAAKNGKTISTGRAYSVGEKAQQEIVSPSKIAVIDPVATEARRQTEAAKVPVVFHFDPTLSDRLIADFSNEFVFTREKFLDVIEQSFKARKLDSNQVDTAKFRKVFNNFQSKNKSYPVGPREAAYWAQHDLDKIRVKKMCDELRRANGQLILPENSSPNDLSAQIRILTKETPASLELAKQQGRLVRRTNMISLAKARLDLMHRFDVENRAVQKFMTNYVAANCEFDAALTGKFRAEKTNAIWAVVSFEAGQVIVRAGEVIDAKTKAALDELKVQTPVVVNNGANSTQLWIGALACFCFALLIGIAAFVRRRPGNAVPAENVLVLPNTENDELRERLMPHLARGLMSRFVRALISQRSDLMRSQDVGTAQLAKLEERLDQIHTRLENRQVFYETRIAQLEKELAAAEEENRELIRAKIREARQNLEWAKAEANGR